MLCSFAQRLISWFCEMSPLISCPRFRRISAHRTVSVSSPIMKQLKFIALHYSSSMAGPLQPALHKKSWAVIDRPYSLGCATVGALYERPRCIFCAKPLLAEEGVAKLRIAGSVLTVAALYERRFFAESTKYRRS